MKRKIIDPTILIITDNFLTKKWFKNFFTNKNFNILFKDTKENAENLVESTALDLIIVDHEMDETNILKYCENLKQKTYKSHTPIILITGNLKKNYRKDAQKMGVWDFLNDDLNEDEFLLKLDKSLNAINRQEKVSTLKIKVKPLKMPQKSLKEKIILDYKVISILKEAKEKKTDLFILLIEYKNILKKSDGQSMILENIRKCIPNEKYIIPSKDNYVITIIPKINKEKAIEISKHLENALKNLDISIAIIDYQKHLISKKPIFENFLKMIATAKESLIKQPDTTFFLQK